MSLGFGTTQIYVKRETAKIRWTMQFCGKCCGVGKASLMYVLWQMAVDQLAGILYFSGEIT